MLPRGVLKTDFFNQEQVFWSEADLVFKSHKGKPITVPAGFLSDGLSIPKVFQSIFSKSPHYIYAGILHDFSYRQDFPSKLTRRQADRLFLFYMKQYGVGFFSRQAIYHAVRIGGWRSYKKHQAQYHHAT